MITLLFFVWIEPVRDWNLTQLGVLNMHLGSVNWTCEGLKRSISFWINFNSASVNWTCEGLKQRFNNIPNPPQTKCELNLWGIETTKLQLFPVWIQSVWIEPVRDWNPKLHNLLFCYLPSVNWTCEGLKRKVDTLDIPKYQSVNWTCEGLKQV